MTSPPKPATCTTRPRQAASEVGAANGTDRPAASVGGHIRSQKCGTSALPRQKLRNDVRVGLPGGERCRLGDLGADGAADETDRARPGLRADAQPGQAVVEVAAHR